MNDGLSFWDRFYIGILIWLTINILLININNICKKITDIEKQLQQVTIMEKSRYMVSVNPKDNWIMVNLDPNDFEIKEK